MTNSRRQGEGTVGSCVAPKGTQRKTTPPPGSRWAVESPLAGRLAGPGGGSHAYGAMRSGGSDSHDKLRVFSFFMLLIISSAWWSPLTRAPLGYSPERAPPRWGGGRFCPLSNSRTDGRRKTEKTSNESSQQDESSEHQQFCFKRSEVRSGSGQGSKLHGFHIIGFRAQLALR